MERKKIRRKRRKKIRKSREKPDAVSSLEYRNRKVAALRQGQGEIATDMVGLRRKLSRTFAEPPTFHYFAQAAMG
ncbi:MAG TPA: hypothetical protein QF468_01605 [Nitrospinota bacterium]|nr:hypothetical protein [Nitrospinota bacterium]